jgi:hypothetical protein
MRRIFVALVLALAATQAFAQEGVTVTSLIAEGYEVKGVIPSSAGPGILLQKDQSLVMCFVAETPESATIATQYCKPVE